ncbi:MAG: dipeptidase [Flavobacteriales bacterium]|nr:dipeptidase [Flavobacteriales bacterium]
MRDSILKYLDENKERFVSELFQLLRIPSVSTDPSYADDVRKTAIKVVELLKTAGADNVELCETAGYPIVYGDKIIDDSLPTVLVYGHYDVQPPEPLELWTSPPFEPVIKDEKIYARGACDDKGQMFMHIKAFEAMVQTNTLNCNLKFLIEGEEECGSENLEGFITSEKEKLKADMVIISDTSMLGNETPSITVGLRGISYLEVELTGPDKDLHSGVYGGTVGNPIGILCDMISSLKDENGFITIPRFYDDVVIASDEEREDMKKIPFDIEKYKSALDVNELEGEAGYTTIERNTIRPCLDVNGIWGGYMGEGAKTVIASKATAKISMRIVPNQDSKKISKLFEDHIKKIAPASVKVKVTDFHGGEPALCPTDSVEIEAASLAMEEAFGVKPICTREGASIPIVALFDSVLGLKTVLYGFGLNSDAIHSPNEHYGLFNFYKGIETIPLFYKYYRELKE